MRFRQKSNNLHKRIFTTLIVASIVFLLLISRLFWIQIINGNTYEKAAISQRIKEVRIAPARGIIYDRNLIPLTNRHKEPYLFIFKDVISNNEDMLEYVREKTKLSDIEIEEILSSSDSIIEIPITEDKMDDKKQIQGLFTEYKTYRYHEDGLLSHVIGYINKSDNTGVSGIEEGQDEKLKMDDDSIGKISITVDGKKRIIPGEGYKPVIRENQLVTNSIKLTIDYHIQKIVEEAIDDIRNNSAVIVAEVETGDIVAMASRPNFDQDNVKDYFDGSDMELFNRAITSYTPGSIFKVIVLLSALENDLISFDNLYYCKGYEEIGSIRIRCHNEEGHGALNIKDAFAQSCNSVFIQLGKELGGKKIMETAKRLGFGESVGTGFTAEKAGNLPEGNDLLGPAIGNISIGQGKIKTTPLQIANMTMIIANNGIKKDLTIVDEVVTEEGFTVKPFPRNKDERVISKANSLIIRNFMEEVVKSGTASSLSLDSAGGGAGKTGSAQDILNGNETVHGWFTGYYPVRNPKYVITVFVEEGQSGGKSAGPIFEKIAKNIEEIRK